MNEYDQYIQSQIAPMLMPGERVLHTAFMRRQPGLLMQMLLVGGLLLILMTKVYFAVLTDRRLILIRTSQGFFSPGKKNLGVEQFDATQMTRVDVSGILNNRSMTFHFRDGSKQKLRISPMFKTLVSGTKAFFEQVPQLVQSGQLQGGQMGQGQAPQQMGGYQQAPQLGQGFAPGARVMVQWSDGNRYPGTVVQAQGDQILCAMQNGQQQWFPAQSVSPG